MNLNDLVDNARKQFASDIHLSSNHPPILRVNGEIRFLRVNPLTTEQVKEIIVNVMTDEQKANFEKEWEIDFAYSVEGLGRFRINAYHDNNGPAAAIRLINSEILTLEQVKAPKVMEKIAALHKGLILVTGPTGSGKTTTVAALIHYINKYFSKHILTVEDPIEFVHKSDRCLINQREVGAHSRSFARALKSALREDPDIIMVGEMRDLETIRLAMTAAETGHLVIGTLHTSSAPQTIDRIIDVFPPEEKALIRVMLSNSIEAVITQQLIRTADEQSRVAAHEVLIANSGIRNLIREGKIPQIFSAMQVGGNLGMQLMKDSVTAHLNSGLITKESAMLALNQGDDNAQQKRSDSIF
ncbi:MAG: type IV pilus twitching motility protein PilT [Sphingobacteriia bacterium]|nr:type IV pilus twitching motility protein PilT [Sphingobacteriia bacterium]